MCPLCQSGNLTHSHVRRDSRGGLKYHDCGTCGLVSLDPRHYLLPAAEKERYDLHQNRPGDAGYEAFLDRLAGPLARKLKAGAEGLDFGSGPGPVLHLLMEKRGFRMSLYDPVYAKDERALERSYDFVTSTEAVEHFQNPGREFELLASLLAPGAYLGLMTKILYEDIDFIKWWYPKDPTHVCFYREKTFDWLAEKKGWELEYPGKDVIIFRKK